MCGVVFIVCDEMIFLLLAVGRIFHGTLHWASSMEFLKVNSQRHKDQGEGEHQHADPEAGHLTCWRR